MLRYRSDQYDGMIPDENGEWVSYSDIESHNMLVSYEVDFKNNEDPLLLNKIVTKAKEDILAKINYIYHGPVRQKGDDRTRVYFSYSPLHACKCEK